MSVVETYVELKKPRDPIVQRFLESCGQGDISQVQAQLENSEPSHGALNLWID